MKILGLIPARGGSKGVPNKNIKLLNGKHLLQYTSDIALQSKVLSKTIVSTDSDQISRVAKSLGLEVPFLRPANLAEDATPTLPVILHALDFLEDQREVFDAVCLLQTTSPFRSIEFLDKALDSFMNSQFDSFVSVLEIPHEYNPHWAFESNENNELFIATGEKSIIPRRQELPKSYFRDGSIYITKTEVLKEQNSLFGNSLGFIVSDSENYVNIDTLEDWNKAELIAKKL